MIVIPIVTEIATIKEATATAVLVMERCRTRTAIPDTRPNQHDIAFDNGDNNLSIPIADRIPKPKTTKNVAAKAHHKLINIGENKKNMANPKDRSMMTNKIRKNRLVFCSKDEKINACLGDTRVASYAGGIETSTVAIIPKPVPLRMLLVDNTAVLTVVTKYRSFIVLKIK
jgi:Fe-S cluster biosynthesis and repair protein YggX